MSTAVGVSPAIADPARDRGGRIAIRSVATFLAIPVVFGLIWETTKAAFGLDERTLPHLWTIANHLFASNTQGEANGLFLLRAACTTAGEALAGFGVAACAGFGLGVCIVYMPRFGRAVMPLIVGSQVVPMLALAPPLLVWLGTGLQTKALVAGYIAFFPVVVFTVRGLALSSPPLMALMRSYAATKKQTFFKVRLPTAVPALFTGLRTAAALAVVGAIVAELPLGSNVGVGRVIFDAAQYYVFDPAALWASTLAAFLLGVTFYIGVGAIEWIVRRRLYPAR